MRSQGLRAPFYAGARALLVSHRYVDSNATVALITKFFDPLKADPRSVGPRSCAARSTPTTRSRALRSTRSRGDAMYCRAIRRQAHDVLEHIESMLVQYVAAALGLVGRRARVARAH